MSVLSSKQGKCDVCGVILSFNNGCTTSLVRPYLPKTGKIGRIFHREIKSQLGGLKKILTSPGKTIRNGDKHMRRDGENLEYKKKNMKPGGKQKKEG